MRLVHWMGFGLLVLTCAATLNQLAASNAALREQNELLLEQSQRVH